MFGAAGSLKRAQGQHDVTLRRITPAPTNQSVKQQCVDDGTALRSLESCFFNSWFGAVDGFALPPLL